VGGADPLFDAKLLITDKMLKDLDPKAGDDKEPGAKDDNTAKSDKKTESALTKLLNKLKTENDNMSSSKELVVLNRHTGKPLWSATSRSGFRHNAICIGGGRL